MQEKEIIPCCIGTADLVEEFMNLFFDDELCTRNGNVYTGFIDGKPAVLRYVGHRVYFDYYDRNVGGIRNRAQRYFDEMDKDQSTINEGYKRVALIEKKSINLYYQEQ